MFCYPPREALLSLKRNLLLAWLLSLFGILKKSFLREYKRHAVVVLLVAAAIITPSGDPFTLMLVFVPLYVLYELSILVVRDKKQ